MSDIQHDANYWIDRLELKPHPEGGYYRETYSSKLIIPKEVYII